MQIELDIPINKATPFLEVQRSISNLKINTNSIENA